MTVQLPAGSRIEAKAAGAEFRAVGRFGDVAFDGAHGSIKLDEAASVRLTALAGDVSVGRLNGPAKISTAKGDIRIAEAVRGTVVLDGVDLAVPEGTLFSLLGPDGSGFAKIADDDLDHIVTMPGSQEYFIDSASTADTPAGVPRP
ncbi:hypothetical protein [Streptosporangium minutum]|uniref:hypothetical protein n=1 Tax=Streptosporangium minutum TaxID=569862 RepID=UPI001F612CDA|nr:hypothetical protein [Streptosporangium minutum]